MSNRDPPLGSSRDLSLGVLDPDDALLTPCRTDPSHPEYDAELPSCPACFDETVAEVQRREAEDHEGPDLELDEAMLVPDHRDDGPDPPDDPIDEENEVSS
jgi:hypothetical protein